MSDTIPTERKDWLGLLARAPAKRVDQFWEALEIRPEHEILRAPEIGSVMMRGRTGATGAPFNIGETTITRCSVRLKDGTVGHGHVQGRGQTHALQAALTDALMQTPARDQVQAALISPLAQAETAERARRAAKAAGTKVDFFTMVRGEDA